MCAVSCPSVRGFIFFPPTWVAFFSLPSPLPFVLRAPRKGTSSRAPVRACAVHIVAQTRALDPCASELACAGGSGGGDEPSHAVLPCHPLHLVWRWGRTTWGPARPPRDGRACVRTFARPCPSPTPNPECHPSHTYLRDAWQIRSSTHAVHRSRETRCPRWLLRGWDCVWLRHALSVCLARGKCFFSCSHVAGPLGRGGFLCCFAMSCSESLGDG